MSSTFHFPDFPGYYKLLLLFLLLGDFAQTASTTLKSKSIDDSHIYLKKFIQKNANAQFSKNDKTTLPQYNQPHTTINKEIPSRLIKTLQPATNQAILSTQKLLKNTSQKTAPHTAERVVYGADDRQEAVSSNPDILNLIQADVALIRSSLVTLNGWGNYDLISGLQTLTFVKGCGYLCSNEPFYNQTVLANCSGVLIGNQYVATAGHCLTVSPCASTAFLFDFKNGAPMTNMSTDNVYFCSGIVSSQYTTQIDYAILQLDRPVVNRSPLPIRRSGEVAVGTPLYLVGHPLGTPMKIAGNAVVKSNNASDGFFSANTDAYDKNSGSMVVNGITWQLEGILVRGNTDFEGNLNLGCCQSKVCPDSVGCNQTDGSFHFEEITKVSTFAAFVPWMWNGNLLVEPAQDTIYHYGIGNSFTADEYQYTLYSHGPTNFTIQLSAPYFGPLLVNGATVNSSGVLLGPDQNLTIVVEVNTANVSALNLEDTYTLNITFKDDITGSVTSRQHILVITNQPSPSVTPSATPSASPSAGSSPSASPTPSAYPSPTSSPSATPSVTPTSSPSASRTPSTTPSCSPSSTPSPFTEPAVCAPCTTNQDCTNQGICTNAAVGSVKYCSCFSGFGGCSCAQHPSSICLSSFGPVDDIVQRFQASVNGSIQSGTLLINVTTILEENPLISVPSGNGSNNYPYSEEIKMFFGNSVTIYPSCNFPRQVPSGGSWRQLAAQTTCLDRFNFDISWDEAKTKCGFAPITADNKTFSQSLTIIRRYALGASSFRIETVKRNVTVTINEIPTNSSNVTVTDVNLYAAITLIEYDDVEQDWTVVVRTILPSPYQLSSASQHLLSGLLATYGRLNRTILSTVAGCTNDCSQCQQNIMYTFLQGSSPNACDSLEGGVITTANITCDDSVNATECTTALATINPVVNISIQLHTGDGCTVDDDITISKATLESFLDSSVSTPATNFDIGDIAYFGAIVESLEAEISMKTLKNGSVCIRRGSTCTPVTYHTLDPSEGKEPVFSIDFLEGDNAAAFGEGSFTLEATIEVTFQENTGPVKKEVVKEASTQQMLGLDASIRISTDTLYSTALRFNCSFALLLILCLFVIVM